MRLIFLVQKSAWFVEHDNAWFRINDADEISLALGGMAMNMVNQHNLVEQPHQAGSAAVTQPDENSLLVVLSSPDHKIVDSIAITLGVDALLSVDWKTKKFRDGWMSADAKLHLDNVGAMYIDAYLPARDGTKGKTLMIQNEQTGSVREVWIARDQKTRIAIVEKGEKGRLSLGLRCDPEPLDQSADPRELGFVLVSEEALPA